MSPVACLFSVVGRDILEMAPVGMVVSAVVDAGG